MEYADPVLPAGRGDVVVMCSEGAAAMVRLNAWLAVWLAASLACTVNP